ncbi:MAG: bifunctional DNA-formamidopyrimidine glycosylase/DNA-(apurinic or apyrimidinic site) lyase [Pseudomonadota bacterium]|nr:bifunctional DNA-formamidopyrimidine glycosylase/DNA-(apurinic or apyrimidinic site) lyase [Pseudomonadota bacterium]
MPELPEVETTRRGIAAQVIGCRIVQVSVRQSALRWPVPDLSLHLAEQRIKAIGRRGKYLLFTFADGTMLIHLGMSGSLRLVPVGTPAMTHDHVEWQLDNGWTLRLNDPRRFGAVLWTDAPVEEHPLICHLGPEPLSAAFDADYLRAVTRDRSAAIKTVLMDSRVVVGVGNIYANEALFRAGIHPARAARRIGWIRQQHLVGSIRHVLAEAIAVGGTTLRDFVGSDGRPGYFAQQLSVYGCAQAPCRQCGTPIRQFRQGQRSSYFCPRCQR